MDTRSLDYSSYKARIRVVGLYEVLHRPPMKLAWYYSP